jgi:hypothetical protein
MKRCSWLMLLAGCGGVLSDPSPSSSGASDASPPSNAGLGVLLASEWGARGLTAKPADADTLLRRLSIDLLGRIPSEDELTRFRADDRTDKVARIVEEMLDDPEHAAEVARRWERLLLGPDVKLRLVDRDAMRRWLESQLAADVPWDEIVRRILLAEGESSVGAPLREALGTSDEEALAEERRAGVEGATNFFVRFRAAPQDLAGTASRSFLGIQLQCAQCHDHKTEPWTQEQFREFAAGFVRVRVAPVDRSKGAQAIFEVENLDRPNRRMFASEDLAAIARTTPRALDGTELGDDPRRGLATWITSPNNPWFARAMVNRVWAELHGAGLVEPVDDLRASNPAVMPAVLDWLARDFVAHRFDLDHLYATVALSPSYAAAVSDGDARVSLFSSSSPTPLSSDQLLASVFEATGADHEVKTGGVPEDRVRAASKLLSRRMETVFAADEESNGGAASATLPQILFLSNGAFSHAATAHVEGGLLQSLLSRDDEDAITTLFRRTLTRDPTPAELQLVRDSLRPERPAAPPDLEPLDGLKGKERLEARLTKGLWRSRRPVDGGQRARALEDVLWALINSNEFALKR